MCWTSMSTEGFPDTEKVSLLHRTLDRNEEILNLHGDVAKNVIVNVNDYSFLKV